jgi:hypothetical protein
MSAVHIGVPEAGAGVKVEFFRYDAWLLISIVDFQFVFAEPLVLNAGPQPLSLLLLLGHVVAPSVGGTVVAVG